jgi:O-antigen ligase
MRLVTLGLITITFAPLINFGPFDGSKVTLASIFGLLTLVYLLAKKRIFFPVFFIALTSCFIATMVISGIQGEYPLDEKMLFRKVMSQLVMFSLYIVGFSLLKNSNKSRESYLNFFYATGVIYAAVSLLLSIIGIKFEEALRTITIFFNNAGTFSLGGISTVFDMEKGIFPRISGLSPEPSFWAIYLAGALAVGVSQKRSFRNWSYILLILITLMTLSRTGYFLLGCLTAIYFLKKRSKVFLYLTGSILPIMFLLFITTEKGLAADWLLRIDDSFFQRFSSLKHGIDLIIDSPIFGLGAGNYSVFAAEKQLSSPVIYNLFLHLSAEGGLLSLTTYLLLLFGIYWNTESRYRAIPAVAFLSWLTVPAFNLPFFWILFGLCQKDSAPTQTRVR